jgi:RNA polymerase-binding transcription factor DksA
MDENQFEQAQRIEEAIRAEGMDKLLRLSAQAAHPDWDGVYCVECGVDIPQGRLLLGKVTCIECQRAKEHPNARHHD